jgi:hypothetical protein
MQSSDCAADSPPWRHVTAEVRDIETGAPAQFRSIRIETRRPVGYAPQWLAKQDYDPKSSGIYTLQYKLKNPNASIWLTIITGEGEQSKQIIETQQRYCFQIGSRRSEAKRGSSAAGRRTSKESRARRNSVVDKIRILFLAANPAGTTLLKLDEEAREIGSKIRASAHRDSLEVITRWAVRPDDLLQYLNESKPHVVHFSGHGSSTEEITLMDNAGNPKSVSKEALVSLFRTLKDNIRVVVLNACYSRPQAEAITGVIDCAIGMSRAIGDGAAITFAASFYRAIGFGRSVREAFEQGKTALLLEGIPEERTPSLLTRATIAPEAIILINPQ